MRALRPRKSTREFGPPSETHGGLLRSPRESITQHHTHGGESGLRNIRMFLKPGREILNNFKVVVPTGFEPVFELRLRLQPFALYGWCEYNIRRSAIRRTLFF